MLNTEKIAELIKKQLDGELTSEEELQLQRWTQEDVANKAFLKKVLQKDILWKDVLMWLELENSDQEEWQRRLEANVFAKISTPVAADRKPVRVLRILLPYAAAILLFMVAGGLYYYLDKEDQLSESSLAIQDVAPGGNKATLRMANGQTINLSDDKTGIIIGDKLTYDDGTLLASTVAEGEKEISFLILETPKGGQYQIELSDGTKVWLNSASTLKYPTRFSGEQRVVELEGEAYFEVTQVHGNGNNNKKERQKVPFLVKTPHQEIKVLGTQFNVSAYLDEPETKTTLVEGSVLLNPNNEGLQLLPGEQGVSNANGSKLLKHKADVMESIAWKNNKFIFNETELRVAMNQLSRWYDLQVVYEGNIPHTYFYGEISRNKSLFEVLKILQAGGVNFKIEKVKEGNKLIVLQ